MSFAWPSQNILSRLLVIDLQAGKFRTIPAMKYRPAVWTCHAWICGGYDQVSCELRGTVVTWRGQAVSITGGACGGAPRRMWAVCYDSHATFIEATRWPSGSIKDG